jgi:hypothetical protein
VRHLSVKNLAALRSESLPRAGAFGEVLLTAVTMATARLPMHGASPSVVR